MNWKSRLLGGDIAKIGGHWAGNSTSNPLQVIGSNMAFRVRLSWNAEGRASISDTEDILVQYIYPMATNRYIRKTNTVRD